VGKNDVLVYHVAHHVVTLGMYVPSQLQDVIGAKTEMMYATVATLRLMALCRM
jgi:hypothetical protein